MDRTSVSAALVDIQGLVGGEGADFELAGLVIDDPREDPGYVSPDAH